MTRRISLVNSSLTALVDDGDYARVVQHFWRLQQKCSRSRLGRNEFYVTRADNRNVSLHRFILSAAPGTEIDHRNSDGLDNRRENLRLATHSQNLANQRAPKNAHGYRGVNKQTWPGAAPYIARITVNYKRINLGTYQTAEAAARAYDQAALKYFGEFAVLNFPSGVP